MPVVVVTFRPKEGRLDELVDLYRAAIPDIHDEPGCELFALHRSKRSVVIIERWATGDDLATHASSEAYKRTSGEVNELLEEPPSVQVIESVAAGHESKGVV